MFVLQSLPPDFCCEMGDKIPLNVYLHVRNCDAWCGLYSQDNAYVKELCSMISFYGIKPYNVVLLQYNDLGTFGIEIFDDYNVEIDYPVRTICFKKPRTTGMVAQIDKQDYHRLELEKMSARFWYNSYGNSRSSFDLLICREHLQKSNKIQV